MRPTTVTVYNESGEAEDVAAFTTSAPGLVVHQGPDSTGWSITHQRSGLLVMDLDNPEQAQAAAGDLAAVADWTLGGNEIIGDSRIMPQVLAIRSKWGGGLWSTNENRETYADRLSA